MQALFLLLPLIIWKTSALSLSSQSKSTFSRKVTTSYGLLPRSSPCIALTHYIVRAHLPELTSSPGMAADLRTTIYAQHELQCLETLLVAHQYSFLPPAFF